jgi:hypothetical protein
LKLLRTSARFLLSKGSEKPHSRASVADLGAILSVENRAGDQAITGLAGCRRKEAPLIHQGRPVVRAANSQESIHPTKIAFSF